LHQVAAAHPDVVDDPPPSVFFTDLGTSAFAFTLYCYVPDRSQIAHVKSDLHYAVVETFRRNNLEMPYPQYDLHLRSGPWQHTLAPPGS
jgi:small-conductance mechanosensitive channel